MFFKGHYQNAYITHDMAKAEQLFARTFGLEDYLRFEPDMVVETPSGPQVQRMKISTAWSGQLQLELIQPVDGYVDFYREVLPDDSEDFLPRFHHAAVRRDPADDVLGEFTRLGMNSVLQGAAPGLVFGYVDARHIVGHYIEYCVATDESWAYNRWPADKPAH